MYTNSCMIPTSSLIVYPNMVLITINTPCKQLITSKPKLGAIFCMREEDIYSRYYWYMFSLCSKRKKHKTQVQITTVNLQHPSQI